MLWELIFTYQGIIAAITGFTGIALNLFVHWGKIVAGGNRLMKRANRMRRLSSLCRRRFMRRIRYCLRLPKH